MKILSIFFLLLVTGICQANSEIKNSKFRRYFAGTEIEQSPQKSTTENAKKSEIEEEQKNDKVENESVNNSKVSLKNKREIPAQTKLQSHSIGLALGQTFLAGEFEKNGQDKITPEFYYAYTASYSFDIVANLHYSEHKNEQTNVIINGMALAIKSRLYQFDSLSPYVLGGLGFYRPKSRRIINGRVENSESKITFGSNIGFGVDLKLNDKYSVGGIFHYHNPFDVKQNSAPDVEGSYYKLLLTLMYSF